MRGILLRSLTTTGFLCCAWLAGTSIASAEDSAPQSEGSGAVAVAVSAEAAEEAVAGPTNEIEDTADSTASTGAGLTDVSEDTVTTAVDTADETLSSSATVDGSTPLSGLSGTQDAELPASESPVDSLGLQESDTLPDPAETAGEVRGAAGNVLDRVLPQDPAQLPGAVAAHSPDGVEPAPRKPHPEADVAPEQSTTPGGVGGDASEPRGSSRIGMVPPGEHTSSLVTTAAADAVALAQESSHGSPGLASSPVERHSMVERHGGAASNGPTAQAGGSLVPAVEHTVQGLPPATGALLRLVPDPEVAGPRGLGDSPGFSPD
ncbi:hypothetical protein RIF23_20300 [Lipingzhangella sp. LS1_29]|uniref:Secreted protein n=1 Tax=Lipingzhangella rawalii TaxID=2055835 RepID=A0ABU2HBD5_9ACTN|nr:hypothetical protein [Lipingzhangella rawalii]MDS1272633.1 hypothetical protein [Lipingzhangella rawalii]